MGERRDEYETSKKALEASRVKYGASIKAVIAAQEKQIGAMRAHEQWKSDELQKKAQEELGKQAAAHREKMKKLEDAHKDHLEDLEDRLDDTVVNLRNQMAEKEK